METWMCGVSDDELQQHMKTGKRKKKRPTSERREGAHVCVKLQYDKKTFLIILSSSPDVSVEFCGSYTAE